MMRKTLLIAILIGGLLIGCGAGGNSNNDATCADVAETEALCLNQIDGEDVRGADFVENFTALCETKMLPECMRCVFETPCIPAESKTPIDLCFEDGRCRQDINLTDEE